MLSRTIRPLTATFSIPSLAVFARPAVPVCLRSFASAPEAAPATPTLDPLQTAEPPSISPTTEPSPTSQLPYFVARNHLNNLGVYHKKKRGGNMKLTYLKHAEGNLQALKKDVRDTLNLNAGDVVINSVTNHIVIKGHKRDEVLSFLHAMNF
ncbi:mitochondrial large subunit ribosomal protein-domain-containing protein [Xylariomycetidae sp. FL0641]|nr:mitochondrial large subunit ribosomal protein-domain-containing protein [Xylariomycetidae sp. FL0641]